VLYNCHLHKLVNKPEHCNIVQHILSYCSYKLQVQYKIHECMIVLQHIWKKKRNKFKKKS
jgi:hypothetical protein